MAQQTITKALWTAAALLAASPAALAVTAYSEAVSGDLSNSGLSPTAVTLVSGANDIFGSTGRPATDIDRDYFTFTVPAGQQLVSLSVLPGTSVLNNLSFIGVQSGPQVTAPVGGPATLLLGWSHYAVADIGSDILPRIGTGSGAAGFTGPLGAGSYSVWVQEASAGTVPYGFSLTLAPVPEPATALLWLGGAAALWLGSRRR